MAHIRSFASVGPSLWNHFPSPVHSFILSASLSSSLSCLKSHHFPGTEMHWKRFLFGLHREKRFIDYTIQCNAIQHSTTQHNTHRHTQIPTDTHTDTRTHRHTHTHTVAILSLCRLPILCIIRYHRLIIALGTRPSLQIRFQGDTGGKAPCLLQGLRFSSIQFNS